MRLALAYSGMAQASLCVILHGKGWFTCVPTQGNSLASEWTIISSHHYEALFSLPARVGHPPILQSVACDRLAIREVEAGGGGGVVPATDGEPVHGVVVPPVIWQGWEGAGLTSRGEIHF